MSRVQILLGREGTSPPLAGGPALGDGDLDWPVAQVLGMVVAHKPGVPHVSLLRHGRAITSMRRGRDLCFQVWPVVWFAFNNAGACTSSPSVPVVRGLVESPEEWAWSSYRHYASGERGAVEIESIWTAAERGYELPEGFKMHTVDGRG